jgi:uncharacterized protein YydD (DUF2326 family)
LIYKVFANKPGFRNILFTKGFNVISADAGAESDEKDSRNGLGKSSLIEIIHFCLGSDLKKGHGLGKDALRGWEFSLELDVCGERVTVHRNTESNCQIYVDGDINKFPMTAKRDDDNKEYFTVDDWRNILGKCFFDLSSTTSKRKYSPSFRQLISYFVRKGSEAYLNPFEYFKNQRTWQRQVCNAYLLGLSWEYARDWQKLKDKEETLNKLKTAAQQGLIDDFFGSLGELETNRLRLKSKLEREKRELDTFKVHPQYTEFEKEVNLLTNNIHALSNKNYSDRQLVSYYHESLKGESPSPVGDVELVYKQAGLAFPDRVKKRLKDVILFHDSIIRNRKDYLNDEINSLERNISDREKNIEILSNKRAEILEILRSHGALDEFNKLNSKHMETKSDYEVVNKQIESLKKFEKGKSALKIDKEKLKQSAFHDYDSRSEIREKAISLFNSNSEALYNRPGELIIDITDNGYDFKVEIDRADSHGIQLMEVFCYDLVLAQLWAEKGAGPGFVIHDSTIFADVDERQIAGALQLANKLSQEFGFQYICCLNSDKIPHQLFKEAFNISKFVRLTLKDDKPESSLFGFRF